jgi:hypothetical protein
MQSGVTWHHGANDWKVGTDAILRHVYERLDYTLTDAAFFDLGTQPQLHFAESLWDVEPAAFMEDTFHMGNWNAAAGLRYDGYSFVLRRHAWSPRIAVSRSLLTSRLLIHASYDRVFQFPAIENLLLASSSQLDAASSFVRRLPVEPARANYYEIGFATEIAGALRLTGNLFERRFVNAPDDDTLLNTGVSFPIAYATAEIHGEEVTLYLPAWQHVLAQLSYSNQVGTATGPITGGLFLGDSGTEELETSGRFPLSQDQRNTLRVHASWSPLPWLWLALRGQYNSGLPADVDSNTGIAQLTAEYGQSVVGRVDFSRGRVRPWSSIDAAFGAHLLQRADRRMDLNFDVANLANTLHVINFASLFSGTAIGAPRSYDARLQWTF